MVIGELHPGMYFGEIGFLFNHNEIVSVKTVTHCEVLTIPRPAYDRVAASVRWFSHQMKLIAQNNKYYEDMCSAGKHAQKFLWMVLWSESIVLTVYDWYGLCWAHVCFALNSRIVITV